MAGLRVFRAYRRLKRPYTRKSKFKKHNFLRGIPNHKIVRFDMGDKTENYSNAVKLVSIRDLNSWSRFCTNLFTLSGSDQRFCNLAYSSTMR